MIFSKYGIRLRRLCEDDIEMVRVARNSDSISNKMIFREQISSSQQLLWYKSLRPMSDFYFVIEDAKSFHPYGLINTKDIDHEKATSESGLFIWDSDAINSFIPVIASWLISEIGYGIMCGTRNKIRVLNSNIQAVSFNKSMGFEIEKEVDGVVYMNQTKVSFSAATLSLRQRFCRGRKCDNSIACSFGEHEFDDVVMQWFIPVYQNYIEHFTKIDDNNYFYFPDF